MIGVVNSGNASSVVAALYEVGADAVLVNDHVALGDMDAVVMPGQGTLAALDKKLIDALGRHIHDGGKYLGICLGLQLLYGPNDEGGFGLSALPGYVAKLPRPRVGWEAVDSERGWFYFCHGYSAGADVVRHGKVTGVQFHPEKSGKDGLRWLSEWARS